jgi:hypothetical protein
LAVAVVAALTVARVREMLRVKEPMGVEPGERKTSVVEMQRLTVLAVAEAVTLNSNGAAVQVATVS